MYDLNAKLPSIQVTNVNRRGERMLTLKHNVHQRRRLEQEDTEASLILLHQLWEYPVSLSSVDEEGKDVDTWVCADGKDVEHT